MPLSVAAAQAAAIEESGSRQRPICLQSQLRRAPPKEDHDARIFAATLGLAGGEPPSRSQRSNARTNHKRGSDAAGARGLANAGTAITGRPISPATHMKHMYDKAQQHIETTPCDEYHRLSWLPRVPPEQEALLEEEAQKALERFATKQHIWGSRPTDYSKNGWYVENEWARRALARSESEPTLSGSGSSGVGAPQSKQPWTKSTGVTSCMVGGVGGGAKGRNVGLYEESFPAHTSHYSPPLHGLASSDVTRLGAAMVAQKELLRK